VPTPAETASQRSVLDFLGSRTEPADGDQHHDEAAGAPTVEPSRTRNSPVVTPQDSGSGEAERIESIYGFRLPPSIPADVSSPRVTVTVTRPEAEQAETEQERIRTKTLITLFALASLATLGVLALVHGRKEAAQDE
jgi:hypothetical protein